MSVKNKKKYIHGEDREIYNKYNTRDTEKLILKLIKREKLLAVPNNDKQ